MITSTLVTFTMILSVMANKPKPDAQPQPLCFKEYKPPTTPKMHLAVSSVDVERRSLDLEAEDQSELPDPSVLAVGHELKVKPHDTHGKKSSTKLRFKTTAPVDWLASDVSPCGPSYKTEEVLGACLWQGTDPTGGDPLKAGWLSGSNTQMCGKELSVARAGKPDVMITVKVIDACSFDIKKVKPGCNQLYLTKKAFDALKPTPAEEEKGSLTDLIWDIKATAVDKPVKHTTGKGH